MLNHILSALGLPKRTEINTTQTPALRRIAGLEDAVEDLQDRLDALAANALAQAKRIDELVKASAEPVKPKRQQTRDPWTVRHRVWLATATKPEQAIYNKTLNHHYNKSLVKAAFAVGLCEWLRHNRVENLPDAGGYVQSRGSMRFKVTIPDLENPDADPVNFGVATELDQMTVQSQWRYLALYVHGELYRLKGRTP